MRRLWLVLVLLLCAAPVSAGTATLSFSDPNSNEQGGHVQRAPGLCTASPLTFATIATIPANVTTYADTTVTEGAAYCYRVSAFNTAGESPWSNTAGLTVPFTVPAAPSLTGVTSGP